MFVSSLEFMLENILYKPNVFVNGRAVERVGLRPQAC
jgi:hypothetical protein